MRNNCLHALGGFSAVFQLLSRHFAVHSGDRITSTKRFCTNFSNTSRGPGHAGKIPRTSQVPSFKNQGKQTFEGGRELFDHHRSPTPPGRTQKLIFVPLLFAGCFKVRLSGPLQLVGVIASQDICEDVGAFHFHVLRVSLHLILIFF